MLRSLFAPDSGLMITLTQVTDCIFLSLFFILGCIPVVTVGASFAALYDATFRGFRRGEKRPWQRFWRVFAANWRGGIVPGLLIGIFLFAIGSGVVMLWNGAVGGSVSWVLFSAGALGGVLAVGIASVVLPMLSRFENSLLGLLKNSFVLSLANAPRTLALGAVNTLAVFLCARFVFSLFFLPALAALIGSLFIEPMFKPYLPPEPKEA